MLRRESSTSHAIALLIALHLPGGIGSAQHPDPGEKGGLFTNNSDRQRIDSVFILHVNLSNCAGCTVVIGYEGLNGDVLDSNATSTDRRTFTGMLSEPQLISVKVRNDSSLMEYEVFLENGEEATLTISGFGAEYSVEGSYAHRDYEDYRRAVAPVAAEMERVDSLFSEALEAGHVSTRDSLQTIMRNLVFRKHRLTAEFVEQHGTSAVGVYVLVTTFYHNFDPALLKNALDAVDDKHKQLKDWKYLQDQILAPALATAVGQQAPGIDMTDIAGHRLRLDDFRGRYVLINFWASWCIPCRAEHKALSALYAKYRGLGFEIVSITLDTEESDWRAASGTDGILWVNYFDGKAFGNVSAKSYGVKAIPASFLLDPNGKIVLRYPDHPDLEQYLDSTLR